MIIFFASIALYAESPVPMEPPMNSCDHIADAECSVGPDGLVILSPDDICDTHGICEPAAQFISNDRP